MKLPVTPAVVSVVAMYAAFTVVGWLASRKARNGTAADLIVAGRQMPLWIAALTMTATWVDGGYLLGTAEAAYKSSIQLGIQGGLCFGISLILGGLFFARTMRRHGFTTLIDPFEARFGKRWAAILFLPALAGELFWSAELLVALGSAFGVLLGMNLTTAILTAAVVTTVYTMLGGMWSVAYTDVFQLGLVAIGLAAAVPFALEAAGGLDQSWLRYAHARPDGHGIVPAMFAGRGTWSTPAVVSWWDVSLMLMLGGIPWNCYFQRVLSCTSPAKAAGQSIVSGLLTIGFTVPPLLMGIAAFSYPWPAEALERLQANPAETLPLLFAHAVPPLVGMLGLAAIVGAVTSSFSSSILSAGSMLSWNCLKRLMWPSLTEVQMARVIRLSILLVRRGGGRLRAEGAERSGALVLHERPGVRPAVSAARVRALRQQGEPDWVDGGVCRLAGAETRRRGTVARHPAFHPVPGTLCRRPSRDSGRLVRPGNRRRVVSVQGLRRRRWRDPVTRGVTSDCAMGDTAPAA